MTDGDEPEDRSIDGLLKDFMQHEVDQRPVPRRILQLARQLVMVLQAREEGIDDSPSR